MRFPWTELILDQVAILMGQGFSAGQIAKEIGTTKNSVIGKVMRDKRLNAIGLKGNSGGIKSTKYASTAKPKSKNKTFRGVNIVRKNAIRVRNRKPVSLKPIISTVDYEADCKRLFIHELGRRECRWPVNEAVVGEHHLFCGKKTDEAKSYCSHHEHKSFGPGTRSERVAIAKAEHIARQS